MSICFFIGISQKFFVKFVYIIDKLAERSRNIFADTLFFLVILYILMLNIVFMGENLWLLVGMM